MTDTKVARARAMEVIQKRLRNIREPAQLMMAGVRVQHVLAASPFCDIELGGEVSRTETLGNYLYEYVVNITVCWRQPQTQEESFRTEMEVLEMARAIQSTIAAGETLEGTVTGCKAQPWQVEDGRMGQTEESIPVRCLIVPLLIQEFEGEAIRR